MNIEILYPEVGNLYGELANISYLERSIDDCKIYRTPLTEMPRFLDKENRVDLVYMGTMTEKAQEIVIETMRAFLDQFKAAVEDGMRILFTGNALEILGREIRDSSGETVDCLGLLPFYTNRNMMGRHNSLYLGKYKDIDIAGYKSQFTESFYEEGALEEGGMVPLFDTVRGDGFHKGIKEEGLRYKNLMATYLIGPLFVLNPPFMVQVVKEAGFEIEPAYKEAAMEAYRARLAEYSQPDRGFVY